MGTVPLITCKNSSAAQDFGGNHRNRPRDHGATLIRPLRGHLPPSRGKALP